MNRLAFGVRRVHFETKPTNTSENLPGQGRKGYAQLEHVLFKNSKNTLSTSPLYSCGTSFPCATAPFAPASADGDVRLPLLPDDDFSFLTSPSAPGGVRGCERAEIDECMRSSSESFSSSSSSSSGDDTFVRRPLLPTPPALLKLLLPATPTPLDVDGRDCNCGSNAFGGW